MYNESPSQLNPLNGLNLSFALRFPSFRFLCHQLCLQTSAVCQLVDIYLLYFSTTAFLDV